MVVSTHCSLHLEFLTVKCWPFYMPLELTTNIKHFYRTTAFPHAGNSDHLAVIPTPAYKPRVQQDKPVIRHVRIWPSEANSALIDSFQTIQWNFFREAATYNNVTDLQEYSVSVIYDINKCIDDVTR